MRKTLALLALFASVVPGAQAQRAWQTEIGIQGGFSRVKPSGTGATDHTDNFDVPSSLNALFFVVPWRNKIALEPSVSFTSLAGAANLLVYGLRADYALTPKAYAAGGGILVYSSGGGDTDYQLGLQAAVGYRLRVTGRLNGRIEASWITTKGTDVLQATNFYSVLFGVSTRL